MHCCDYCRSLYISDKMQYDNKGASTVDRKTTTRNQYNENYINILYYVHRAILRHI